MHDKISTPNRRASVDHWNNCLMDAREYCAWLEQKLVGTASMPDRFQLTHPHWDAPPPIEPERIEDEWIPAAEIEADAEPTTVEIYDYVGDMGDIAPKIVEVRGNWPPYRLTVA